MRHCIERSGLEFGNRVSYASVLVMVLAVACGGRSSDASESRAKKPGDGEKQHELDAGAGESATAGGNAEESNGEGGTAGGSSGSSSDDGNAGDDGNAADDGNGADDGDGNTGSGSEGSGPDAAELPSFDCSAAAQQFDSENMQPYDVSEDVTQSVEATLQAMDSAAKATQLMGIDGTDRNYRDMYRSIDVEVPGVGTVRGFRYRDAGRGVNLDAGQDNRVDSRDYSTAFPTPAVRAAAWDLALERRVGAAIGDETAAAMNNVLLAPVAGLVRHPYWGRAQEAYGEDPYSAGRMATAFTVGAQEYVLSCAKHFVANDIERGREQLSVVLTEQSLREVYARPFEMLVRDGGVGCVMAAYNLVNQTKATQNAHLLTDVLKAPVDAGGMGFEGFVITDWWAMPGSQKTPDDATAQAVAIEALSAGTDVEVPWTLHYNPTTLATADQSRVSEAARRVLTQKYRFNTALATDAWGKQAPSSTLTDGSISPNEEHEALAEEAAVKSAVLLRNGLDSNSSVLPLTSAMSVAVIGLDQQFRQISSSLPRSCSYDLVGHSQPETTHALECVFRFAIDPALGDRGSSRVNADPERSIGPFDGIQRAGGDRVVTSGNSVDAAAAADAVVVVVGYTPGDEGEEYYIETLGDRSSLDLPPGHNDLVQSVLDLDKPTVIIIESGSIVNLPWLAHANQKQATIWAGYPGMRGGLALGKLIFGQANFSGKMPMAWPMEDSLPPFKDSDTVTSLGYFFGYRELDRRRYVDAMSSAEVFPFGHGLSYSSFEYANLQVPCEMATKDAVFNVTVDITNTSSIDGDEVAMLFVKPPALPEAVAGERPWKELKSFARVSVPAGQSVTAELPLRIADLRRWEGEEDGRWLVDSGEYKILVGKNADDAESETIVGSVMVDGD